MKIETLSVLESQLLEKENVLNKIRADKYNLESTLKTLQNKLAQHENTELFIENQTYVYDKTITIGKTTTNSEKNRLAKKYLFFGSNVSIYATSKKIIGMTLLDKWGMVQMAK